MINNFEWKKIITRNDTKEKFPIQSLIGKKIIGINIIGGVKPWNSEPYINCCTEAKGPIIFVMENDFAIEISGLISEYS